MHFVTTAYVENFRAIATIRTDSRRGGSTSAICRSHEPYLTERKFRVYDRIDYYFSRG